MVSLRFWPKVRQDHYNLATEIVRPTAFVLIVKKSDRICSIMTGSMVFQRY